ncbi:MAG: alanine--tRNA ligase [Candidatus Omnitrophota bacterium]|jgi:alanyl-tRNA synthetase
MKTDVLREKFLEFFKNRQHKIVGSDSLVPQDDPTVLFTPAGMNQFKKQFLGLVTDYRRAASSQRCLRTDDLDKVGKTSGHHTFFEMLGNFSFGDYFKEDAITWGWEFLTQELKMPQEKLWVSVYKDDNEAYAIWKDTIKVPEQRIVRLGDKDNFWPSDAKEKGPNGPCGPCSEIFFDQGKLVGCGKDDCDPGCSCGRFLEVWNLVFTQFNRKDAGVLEPLPQKNIDTGMGLERLAAVMQGVKSNFETDLFAPLIKEITQHAKHNAQDSKEFIYAVTDHIRAISFSIYDGVLPANEGRGYIVRKLIRKSCLHLRGLGLAHPFLYTLVPVLSSVMKVPYPDLEKRRENIAEIILAEEKSFIDTLNASPELLKEKFHGFINSPDAEKVGVIAFQLYDTYGIPFELTKHWLDTHRITISFDTFEKEVEKQKSRSKSQSQMKGDVFSVKELQLGIKESVFLGYNATTREARIVALIKDTVQIQSVQKDDEVTIILDETVFYGESGGQVGDTGHIENNGNIFEVTATKKIDKVVLHIGRVKAGTFKKGDRVVAKLDVERRLSIARNHTATHLLQSALRKVLGAHVQQQGSFVAAERLRFDFTHFKDIAQEELDRIEEAVNRYVMDDRALDIHQMSLAEAKKTDALAFFGEKYEDEVRVVAIAHVSLELCGGTHLTATGQIGLFKIIQEGSVASGVRRIEAVTGHYAYKAIKQQEAIIEQVSELLQAPEEKLAQEAQKKIGYIKELEKQLNAQKLEAVKSSIDSLIKGAQIIKDILLITHVFNNVDMDLLRKTVDMIKQKTDNCVIALGSTYEGKAFLVTATNFSAQGFTLDAGKLNKEIAPVIGGSGGGRKDFAQAGGTKPENFPQAFAKLKEIIAQEVGK